MIRVNYSSLDLRKLALGVIHLIFASVALLILLSVCFNLAAAWFAPRCYGKLEPWCLPIGWEGPFADFWQYRSFFNSRINAMIDFIAALAAIGCAIYFSISRHKLATPIAYACGLALLMFFMVKQGLMQTLS